MTSCNKEPLAGSVAPQRYDPTDRILDFLQKVQSAHAGVPKTGEGFSSDSAIWYMESSLNYTLGNIGKAYNMSTVDSIAVPLTLGGTSTSNAVVYAAFENLVALLAPLTTEEQHIVVVDVVEPMPGACDLLVLVTIGSDYSKGAPNTAYGASACYYYGGPTIAQSYCACGCSTLQSSLCANIIIQNRINAANFYALQNGQYVTNVETWNLWNFDQISSRYISPYNPLLAQAPVGDGYRDTKPFSIFINNGNNSGLCLSPTEMTYWTGNASQGTWSAISAIKNTYCPSKLFLGCTISPSISGLSVFSAPAAPYNGPGLVYWHRASYRYGIIVTLGTGG